MTSNVPARQPAAYCYQPFSNYIDMVLNSTKCQKKEFRQLYLGVNRVVILGLLNVQNHPTNLECRFSISLPCHRSCRCIYCAVWPPSFLPSFWVRLHIWFRTFQWSQLSWFSLPIIMSENESYWTHRQHQCTKDTDWLICKMIIRT